ncbi:poly(rC)-binding protein 3 isoform X2 [Bradysia coprophila]|uniref:poly(rC)-binding protein 3 isoform X2 n=1 Tax=Bradysia coprophila TaxID=38358 RepID=UPI00187DA849|nr:poly(rC)-binding protein 3 isoform X2 [Bradysia coprophila]XP_037034932.1 poly(rC)-binding protein 3 isoform X2 [Bradysia coprophila]
MDESSAVPNINMKDDPSVKLTIRLIMQGKEVGSIIGKKGEIVKRFREESGATINISDGSCPERIVTVSGSTNAIFKAFSLITKKFEEWCSQFNENGTSGGGGKTQIPIRLIVPASQCGSLIGKGGSKIKEIRDTTGCSVQVASEMLPNSTERAVTLSGSAGQITQCIYHICCVMLESPPKGATIPYRPKPQVNGPVILANGQAYTIQGNYAVPTQEMSGLTKNPLASLAALGLAGMAPSNTGGLNPTALAALAGSQLRSNNQSRGQPQQQSNQQQQEMTVPNDLIGCIIGKGGTKIAEIRHISGAMIRISNCEEREGGNTDRTITISGNPDSVALAQYLINMSVELQKANLQESNNQSSSSPSAGGSNTQSNSTTSLIASSNSNNSLASAIPLAQLLTKPGALNALTSLSALGGLTDLLGGLASNIGGPPVQTTGVHRQKNFTPRVRSPNSMNERGRNDRNKFNPY